MRKLINKKELASLLGISIYTVDKMVACRSGLAFVKIHSRVLFEMDDVENYIKQNKKLPLKVGDHK